MDKDEKQSDKLDNGVSPYQKTKWGPDREHPLVFNEDDNSEEREFFEGKEHLEEVYPGISKGMLVNFSINGALFDPVSQMPSDMKANYEAMAKVIAKKDFSYDKMAETMELFDIYDEQVNVLVERAYLNSEAFRMRTCRSLGYDSVEQMPRDVKEAYDGIVRRAQDSNEYLKVLRDVNFGGSFYSDSGKLIDRAETAIRNGELEDYEVELTEKGIRELKSLYVDGVTDPRDGVASVNPYEVKKIGVDVTAHEMAHYVYNRDMVNPGVHEKDNEYKEGTYQLGRKGSPLDEIDRQKIKYNLAYLINSFGGNTEMAKMVHNPQTSEEREMAKEEKEHDNAGFERAADIHGVRMLMFKEGIFNPFDGSDVTPEQVEKFMEAHPDSRILRYWNKGESRFFLNNIASNDSLRETVGKNILAAIDEDGRDNGAVRGNSFGNGLSATSVDAQSLAATAFQQINDGNIEREQQNESKGLSV